MQNMQNVITGCQWSILIEYYNRIAQASMLHEFTDGPAAQRTGNPPNSEW